jgi:hypothetical protein
LIAVLAALCTLTLACVSGGNDSRPADADEPGEVDPNGVVRLAYDLDGGDRGGFTSTRRRRRRLRISVCTTGSTAG